MRNLIRNSLICLAFLSSILLLSGCDDDLSNCTTSSCENPIHLGIGSISTDTPYTGDFIWSSVPEVDSFCFSFIWNNEVYIMDSIVTDTTFSFSYGFLPGDTLVLCVASYCNNICTDPPRKDTIIFNNGLAEDDIVFLVPPTGTKADSMCTSSLICDVIKFTGNSVKYKDKTIQIGSYYSNNYYRVGALCTKLQNNGDNLLNAMQTSIPLSRTSGDIPCN